MFITLLAATLAVALATAALVAWAFHRPVGTILRRIVTDDLGAAWHRYVTFAILVVGIAGGVRIWDLEKYITPRVADDAQIVLNAERWTLEIYRTLIGTLASTAYMLLAFFAVALIALVIVRGVEYRYAADRG